MNASDIIRLLNTNHYAPADLEEVNKLCSRFPEFSTAHLLKVRILEALGHEKQRQLKVAAVYSMNRKKLMQLVTDMKPSTETEPEPEAIDESSSIIQFSDEPYQDAEVIIEQHAPYAAVETGSDLLELDEEAADELLVLDEERTESSGEEENEEPLTDESSVELLVEKDETDMEEPETEHDEIPSIDRVDNIQDNKNNHLISSFIKEEPGPIRADKETGLKGDVSLASIREHDGFITDTLAQIYVKQGLFAKAIYAYEKLSLKYPEKSAYFAAQIEKIRNINHS
jgi:hypothetical protein